MNNLFVDIVLDIIINLCCLQACLYIIKFIIGVEFEPMLCIKLYILIYSILDNFQETSHNISILIVVIVIDVITHMFIIGYKHEQISLKREKKS